MGLAAVAMAASMFAVDFSANLRLEGNLFSYDKASKTVKVLSDSARISEWYKAPAMAFSVSSDKAGGSFYLDNNNGGAFNVDHYAIWFKPFDIMKVEIGAADGFALNSETIDYTQAITGIGDYSVSINTNGFFAGVNVAADLITKVGDGKAAINQIYGKLAYGGDWGTVGAIAKFNNSFKQMAFGAGYAGNFGSVSTFVDVYYANCAYTEGLRNNWENFYGADKPVIIDAFAKQQIDAFGWAVYTGVVVPTGTGDTSVLAKAKLTYAVGGVTPYIFVEDKNILAKDFSMVIQPGVTGNLGGMAWEVACKVTAQEALKVEVPFNVTIAF